MEGQFYSDHFEKLERYRLNPRKQEHISICSFSSDYKSHLMWSHYADGHRGMAIGFDIDETKYTVEKVNYNGLLNLNIMPSKFKDVKDVFLNKIKDWKYEKEYRIITESQGFITIEIKEIIFGAETPKEDKAIIEKLIKSLNKKIKIETYYG
jgi:hypothetical protein